MLIPFEKKLPSLNIKEFVVTPEVVDNPHEQLSRIMEDPCNPELKDRFEKARRHRIEEIKDYIRERLNEFKNKKAIEIYDQRIDLIISIYFKNLVDINRAFEIFYEMYQKIKEEEASLSDRIDVGISFDDGAIDEIIKKSLDTGEDPDDIAYHVAKGLEYGLKLVRDRSGIDNFILNKSAIIDMDNYINGLIKKYYRQEITRD